MAAKVSDCSHAAFERARPKENYLFTLLHHHQRIYKKDHNRPMEH